MTCLHRLVASMMLIAGISARPARAVKGSDCRRRLSPTSSTVERITSRGGRDEYGPALTPAEVESRWIHDPALRASRAVTIVGPFQMRMDLLAPEDFDLEIRGLLMRLLNESHSAARMHAPVAAAIDHLHRQRANLLAQMCRGYEALTGERPGEDLMRSYRESLECRARAAFANGIEVGAWVVNYVDGERDISPIFSDCGARAHEELDVGPALARTHRANYPTRSAQLFHTQPDSFLLSGQDIEAVHTLLASNPFLREVHIYAIAQRSEEAPLIAHYGHRVVTNIRYFASTTSRRSRDARTASR